MAGLTVLQAATHTYGSSYLGFAQAPVRQIVGTDQSFRSAGPIGDPNFYALVLAALVPVALMRLRDESRPALRVAAGAAALLLGAAIVLTFSRGGLVALLAALLLFVCLARVRPAVLVACALVALPLLLLVPSSYRQRVETLRQGDNSISRRVASQDVAVQMFVAHPLGGVGANNYAVSYLPYALRANEPAAAEEPHNLYLAIAAETGLLGLAAFTVAVALVVARAVRVRAAALRAGDRAAEGIATACLLALATYLVGVAFLPIAYPRYLWTFVGLALALPAAAPATRARRLPRVALEPAAVP
jgi:O-antigen ligase